MVVFEVVDQIGCREDIEGIEYFFIIKEAAILAIGRGKLLIGTGVEVVVLLYTYTQDRLQLFGDLKLI